MRVEEITFEHAGRHYELCWVDSRVYLYHQEEIIWEGEQGDMNLAHYVANIIIEPEQGDRGIDLEVLTKLRVIFALR